MSGPINKINLQVLHLYILLKMGAYEQEKCVMLSNEINLEIDIYYCLHGCKIRYGHHGHGHAYNFENPSSGNRMEVDPVLE